MAPQTHSSLALNTAGPSHMGGITPSQMSGTPQVRRLTDVRQPISLMRDGWRLIYVRQSRASAGIESGRLFNPLDSPPRRALACTQSSSEARGAVGVSVLAAIPWVC